jgi:regulator of cell morphogenesis and NO signaling
MPSAELTPTPIPTAATLGSIVAERPEAAAVLEGLGLDYCCGGAKTLDEACRERGLDPATVAAVLDSIGAGAGGQAAHDVARASIGELCEHIVDVHHRPLHPRLERISELLGKVVRAHGANDPSVGRLQERFEGARADLVDHMRVEEQELFPACRELDRGNGDPGVDRDLLPHLEDDHGGTGAALAEIRELAGDYRPERAHCNTHRVLLHELAELELELHRHIHEENNVLFPMVRERLDVPA